MTNVYISPTGAGNRSGSSAANAAVLSNLSAMVQKAGPDGSVLLIADQGSYKVSSSISISSGGTAGHSVTIKGVSSSGAPMDATIEGTRPAVYSAGNASGNELFKLQVGGSNLKFENLQVNNTGNVFRAAGDVSNISIEHVSADNVARFFDTQVGGTNTSAKVTGLTIRDVDVVGFSKSVVSLDYASSKILIEDVRGDSQGQDGDGYAMGIHLGGTTHDVVIRRTTMMNATDTTSSSYWNGDGFATERGVYNVLFEDTVSRGNTDAGYDLKSASTTLIRALADGNARNYRIWGDTKLIDSTGLDPHKDGGSTSQAQVWVGDGAKLVIAGGHFRDSSLATNVFQNRGSITVTDTDVTLANAAHLLLGNALNGSVTVNKQGAAVAAPAPAAVIAAPVVDDAIVVVAGLKFVSTTQTQKVTATAQADTFKFDQSMAAGKDVLTGFGSSDVLLTTKALSDGNRDGLIGFGKDHLLDLGSGAGKIGIGGIGDMLRFVGTVDGDFAYAEASVRPKGALEAVLGSDVTLRGDAGDKAASRFFFDTALGHGFGHDKILNFGSRDILVTTTQMDADFVSGASRDFGDPGAAEGSLSISDAAGHAVTALEYDGMRTVGDVHYYVYSLAGSDAGLADFKV